MPDGNTLSMAARIAGSSAALTSLASGRKSTVSGALPGINTSVTSRRPGWVARSRSVVYARPAGISSGCTAVPESIARANSRVFEDGAGPVRTDALADSAIDI
ncbi:Uncharacterised protein [Mycobacteroides abscessus subsp. abscessus]|nr:Uncharacterised protein [Mycobacteroides abscessus subsp. abscessus]